MKKLLIAALATTCVSVPVLAQDSKTVIEAGARAMGATSLESIQYSGTGSVFMFGQAARPDAPWPRFIVVKYVTAVNYNPPALREELVRTEVESTPHGGGAGGFNPATGQGGMPIKVGEDTIGGIAVGGAPGGDKDEACAIAGIDKIKDRLN